MGKIKGYYTMPHPPIIIPELGGGEERKIQKTYDACKKVAEEIENIQPDTIIVVTPHGPLFTDAITMSDANDISGDLSKFGVSEVKIACKIDNYLTKDIIKYATQENIVVEKINKNTAPLYQFNYEMDHGTLVPLYFINQKFNKYKLVHITYGLLPKMDLYKFGMCINKAVEESNNNVVFIASGDLSHRLADKGPYDYSPYGKKFDKQITSLLKKGDVVNIFNMEQKLIEEAGECALRTYYIMLGAMNGNKIEGDLLSYEGTFGVGYAVMKFKLEKCKQDMYALLIEEKKTRIITTKEEKNKYVKLARESLAYYLAYGDYIEEPDYVTDEMKYTRRGVFVSLKKDGQLRGCIGTVFPDAKNVAEEIIKNAIKAGLHDPRFPAVTSTELDDIEFSVDVLTEPEESGIEELNPKKYGVIVRSGFKVGLLLPDLEGIGTVEEQINIALQKGNIESKETYSIERFEVIRHS